MVYRTKYQYKFGELWYIVPQKTLVQVHHDIEKVLQRSVVLNYP